MSFWKKYERYIKMGIFFILYIVIMFTPFIQMVFGVPLSNMLGISEVGCTSYVIIMNVTIYLLLFSVSLFMVPDIYYLDYQIFKRKMIDRKILEIVIGIVVVYASALIGNVFSLIAGGEMDSANEEAINSVITAYGSWAFLPVVIIIGPIVEEVVFRGIVQSTIIGNKFAKRFSPRVIIGIVVTALLFGLIHVFDAGDYVQIFPYFFMGLSLGIISYETKSIFPSAIVHILNNAIATLLPLLLS